MIDRSVMGYYITSNGSALMAHPDNPLPAMLMAERERNEPQAGGVLLRDLAYREGFQL